MSYLHSHFSEPTLSIQEIAKQANMSEQHFRRLFKEAYGISPKQYLIELRINQAKQMLLESAASVTCIAENCGFSSVYYFCYVFKSITNQTPTEYAKHG